MYRRPGLVIPTNLSFAIFFQSSLHFRLGDHHQEPSTARGSDRTPPVKMKDIRMYGCLVRDNIQGLDPPVTVETLSTPGTTLSLTFKLAPHR